MNDSVFNSYTLNAQNCKVNIMADEPSNSSDQWTFFLEFGFEFGTPYILDLDS